MNYHKTQTPQMNSNEAADALGVKFEHSIISTVNFRNEISIEIKLEQSFEIFMIAVILYLLMAWILTAFFSVFFTRRAEKKSLDNALTPQWTLSCLPSLNEWFFS